MNLITETNKRDRIDSSTPEAKMNPLEISDAHMAFEALDLRHFPQSNGEVVHPYLLGSDGGHNHRKTTVPIEVTLEPKDAQVEVSLS